MKTINFQRNEQWLYFKICIAGLNCQGSYVTALDTRQQVDFAFVFHVGLQVVCDVYQKLMQDLAKVNFSMIR